MSKNRVLERYVSVKSRDSFELNEIIENGTTRIIPVNTSNVYLDERIETTVPYHRLALKLTDLEVALMGRIKKMAATCYNGIIDLDKVITAFDLQLLLDMSIITKTVYDFLVATATKEIVIAADLEETRYYAELEPDFNEVVFI